MSVPRIHAGTGSRPRHSTYATKLFDGRRRRRSTTARPGARRKRRREQHEPTLFLVGLAILFGAVIAAASLPSDDGPVQRPDPAVYRQHLDLVSVDRVGTMFYGVVSQGFFMLDTTARRQRLEGLVRHIRDEGFESLYLAEASGRTVARWTNTGLEVLPDSDPGS